MAQRKYPDWAILDIADIGNGDPNKEDPGTTKQQEGWKVEKPFLQHMNWLQNLFGHFTRANNEYKNTLATGTEGEVGEIHVIDNTLAAKTFLLPGSPFQGQWIRLTKLAAYSVFPVTINGNGKDVGQTSTTSLEFDVDLAEFAFYFDGVLWKILKTAAYQTATGATSGLSGYFSSDTPVGATFDWFGPLGSIPSSYVPMDGTIHTVSTYPLLAALLGSTFGGDGVVTFGVPDMRGRVLAGMDNMGTTPGAANRVVNPQADAVGGVLGTETHTLVIGESPSHNHNGVTGSIGNHTHSNGVTSGGNQGGGGSAAQNVGNTGSAGAHNHTIPSQGGGGAHNNMQPALFAHKIIKAQ